MSQVYGYARVSTEEQDAERQVSEILTYCQRQGLGDPVIVRETASGAKARPQLDGLIGRLGKGDKVLVWELSRLTRGGVAALFALVKAIHDAGAALVETKSGTTIDEQRSRGSLCLCARAGGSDRTGDDQRAYQERFARPP